MRNVNVLKVYNLVDSKGNKLQLRLGELRSRDDVCASSADKGYRWSFIGDNIPMPVRSLTWFNGFPEATMLDWLKGNGWYPHTCVDLNSGYAKVYDLPKGNEMPILPDTFGTDQYPALGELDKPTFDCVIRELYTEGRKVTAVRLYRYVYGGTLSNATKAIKEICKVV